MESSTFFNLFISSGAQNSALNLTPLHDEGTPPPDSARTMKRVSSPHTAHLLVTSTRVPTSHLSLAKTLSFFKESFFVFLRGLGVGGTEGREVGRQGVLAPWMYLSWFISWFNIKGVVGITPGRVFGRCLFSWATVTPERRRDDNKDRKSFDMVVKTKTKNTPTSLLPRYIIVEYKRQKKLSCKCQQTRESHKLKPNVDATLRRQRHETERVISRAHFSPPKHRIILPPSHIHILPRRF